MVFLPRKIVRTQCETCVNAWHKLAQGLVLGLGFKPQAGAIRYPIGAILRPKLGLKMAPAGSHQCTGAILRPNLGLKLAFWVHFET